MKNIEKYKSDLQLLIDKGEKLDESMQYSCHPENIEKKIKAVVKDDKKVKEYIKKILPFNREYQSWYSESLVLLRV